MTTIIDIVGTDPETLENYVLLCGDSRGILSGRSPLDVKKIFAGENSNYAFGIAGRSISNQFSENFDSEIYKFITAPKVESRKNIEAILNSVDDEFVKRFGECNDYLISIKEDVPELLTLSENKLIATESYKSIGSGKNFTYALNALDKYNKNERIYLSKKDALEIALAAMNEAAANDEFTGGHMDVAIVTSSAIKYLPSYRTIDKSSKVSVPTLSGDESPQSLGAHPYQMED